MRSYVVVSWVQHPRGSEISFMLYGSIEFGMVEENAGMNRLVFENITQNETIHVPQGESERLPACTSAWASTAPPDAAVNNHESAHGNRRRAALFAQPQL